MEMECGIEWHRPRRYGSALVKGYSLSSEVMSLGVLRFEYEYHAMWERTHL